LLLFWELLALAGIGLGAVFALFGVCFPGPGLAPAGDFLFLRVQEKEAKEARPCCPYPLRFAPGQPAVLALAAAWQLREPASVRPS
jgi:hypothetical protein